MIFSVPATRLFSQQHVQDKKPKKTNKALPYWPFARGISHRLFDFHIKGLAIWPVESPYKGPEMQKLVPSHDIIFFSIHRVELNPDAPIEPRHPINLRDFSGMCFFPSISLVNSMPVKPEDVLQIAKTTSWEVVSKGGRQLDERIKSAKTFKRQKPVQQWVDWGHEVTEICVNIGSGNGLLPDVTKPLLEVMLIYHYYGPVAFMWGQFHRKYLRYLEITASSPRGQWVNGWL